MQIYLLSTRPCLLSLCQIFTYYSNYFFVLNQPIIQLHQPIIQLRTPIIQIIQQQILAQKMWFQHLLDLTIRFTAM